MSAKPFIVALIQARMDSSRLPKKVLMNLVGKSVLERVVERVQRSQYISEVVVVTSIQKSNLEIAKICANNDIRLFIGSENDVLDRYYQAAKLLQPDHVVRITADCPLIDAAVIDEVIGKHLAGNYDYTSNTLVETYPDGQDIEIFRFSALETAWQKAELLSEREHVTPYIKKNEGFSKQSIESAVNYNHQRWTLDEPNDWKLIETIYQNLYPKNPFFGMQEIQDFLRKNPELEQINSTILRNEGYHKSLQNDKKIV